jgi:glycosyltransferase involved in cell wall biosynthesis
MKKLRVAFFIDRWNPGSGTENQLRGMLEHFDPQTVSPLLVTLRGEVPGGPEGFPCPVHCLGVGSLLSPGGAWRFVRALPWLRRLDVDVAMIYFVDSNLFAVPLCRLAGVPNVVINRRDMGYWYDSSILKKLNLVNRWADYFLTNSLAVKRQVEKHEKFDPARVHVHYNGLWTMAPDDSGPGAGGDEPRVGITASLRQVKRVDRFIDMAGLIAERNPAVSFHIAGQGNLKDDLEARAASVGIGNRTRFHGQVSDVRGFLADLQVAVLTSESEGLSNSLIEYAVLGLPVVTFDTGGNREVVVDGETGFLVPEGDVEALADRVCRLLEDGDLRRRMGEAGRRRSLALFSPGKAMEEMMKFLDGITRGPRRGYPYSPADGNGAPAA